MIDGTPTPEVSHNFPARQPLKGIEHAQFNKRAGSNESTSAVIEAGPNADKALIQNVLQNPFSESSQQGLQHIVDSTTRHHPQPQSMRALAMLSDRDRYALIKSLISENDTPGEYEKRLHTFSEEDEGIYKSQRDKVRSGLTREIATSAGCAMRLRDFFETHRLELLTMADTPEKLYTQMTQEAFESTDIDDIASRYSITQRVGFRLAMVNFIQDMQELKAADAHMAGFSLQQKVQFLYHISLPEDTTAQLELTPLGFRLSLPPDEFVKEKTAEQQAGYASVRRVQLDPNSSQSIPIIAVKQYSDSENQAIVRQHEEEHVFYRLFNHDRTDSSVSALKKVLAEENYSKAAHRLLAVRIGESSFSNMYHELAAYFAERDRPLALFNSGRWDQLYNEQSDPHEYFSIILDYLDQKKTSTGEKRAILGIYLRAYQKQLLMHQALPIALEHLVRNSTGIKRQQYNVPDNENVSYFDEMRALLLITEPRKVYHLLRQWGEDPMILLKTMQADENMVSAWDELTSVVTSMDSLSPQQQRSLSMEDRVTLYEGATVAELLANQRMIPGIIHALQSIRIPDYLMYFVNGLSSIIELQYATHLPGRKGQPGPLYSPDRPLPRQALLQAQDALRVLATRNDRDFAADEEGVSPETIRKMAADALTRMARIEKILGN